MKLSQLPAVCSGPFLRQLTAADCPKSFVERIKILDKDIESCFVEWLFASDKVELNPEDKLMFQLVQSKSGTLRSLAVAYYSSLVKGAQVEGGAEQGIVSHKHKIVVVKPAETGSRSLNVMLTGLMPDAGWKPLDAGDLHFAKEYRVVMSVRHPFERAVHLFRRLLAGADGWMSPKENYRFLRCCHSFDKSMEENFRAWVLTYKDKPEIWESPLFVPFSQLLGPHGFFTGPFHWVRMERIHVDANDLRRILDLPLDTTHPYVGWHGDVDSYAGFYDHPEVAATISRIYAKDMELCGYKTPSYVTINS